MQMKKGTVAVKVEHLNKSFGGNTVLSDINLEVYQGENVVVLGKSGSGKSVLIKCLVRLIEPDEGRVEILGQDIMSLNNSDLNVVRRKIGFLFQSGALYDSMTVGENLRFPLRGERKSTVQRTDAAVREGLLSVGLEESIDKYPSELSGGMRKRVGLARTLVMKPQVMLYDEPTTGLDPITSKQISHLILDVQKKYNTSSIIITHDVECARITANRIVIIDQGLFIADGSFEELRYSTDNNIRSFFE